LLRLVELWPSRWDELLGCAHISVSFTDIRWWLLREDDCANSEG
jgi:hypothetical protein